MISCGAIVLYCLNLPLEIRFLSENVYILAMMPRDGADIWTMPHVLDTLRDRLIEYDLPGKLLPTFSHPNGVMGAARVYMTIADLQASKKLTGSAAATANYFCTYCLLHYNDLDSLDYNSWTPRNIETVQRQALEYQAIIGKTKKEEFVTATGVRWTPLYDFSHWDPIRHTVLGWMHNGLEGIAEDHLRRLWGIGRDKKTKDLLKLRKIDEQLSDADTNEARSDLESLISDIEMRSLDEDDNGSDQEDIQVDVTSLKGMSSSEDDEDKEGDPTPPGTPGSGTHFYRQVMEWDIENEEDEEENGDKEFFAVPEDAFEMSTQQIRAIQLCIRNVWLPSWVERPPQNLGESKHGKLKAHQLHVLFSVIFPLIIPELWFNGDEVEQRRLANFCNLVASLNILGSYSASNGDADMFTQHYHSYLQSKQELYPDFHSLPNHHFAYHYPDQIKFWGPMSTISEFPGEKLNGELANIPTNKHPGKS